MEDSSEDEDGGVGMSLGEGYGQQECMYKVGSDGWCEYGAVEHCQSLLCYKHCLTSCRCEKPTRKVKKPRYGYFCDICKKPLELNEHCKDCPQIWKDCEAVLGSFIFDGSVEADEEDEQETDTGVAFDDMGESDAHANDTHMYTTGDTMVDGDGRGSENDNMCDPYEVHSTYKESVLEQYARLICGMAIGTHKIDDVVQVLALPHCVVEQVEDVDGVLDCHVELDMYKPEHTVLIGGDHDHIPFYFHVHEIQLGEEKFRVCDCQDGNSQVFL